LLLQKWQHLLSAFLATWNVSWSLPRNTSQGMDMCNQYAVLPMVFLATPNDEVVLLTACYTPVDKMHRYTPAAPVADPILATKRII